MATLPRMRSPRQKIHIPFSTSPRKLQEMTFPDGYADMTSASGSSMKQYEEQLNAFKKENFHLKLRIYFLEEKLGNGSPPAVQGLLEHNVRLQVEMEELRRQLSDKQQLLADAAQAIDVLEQQGSVSMDSDASTGTNTLQRRVQQLEEQVTVLDEAKPSNTDTQATAHVTDATTDGLATTDGKSDNHEQVELLKLRREHHKALQMIKGCMKRIQQQEKEINALKLEAEATEATEPKTEKYEEVLMLKEKHINDLEQKLREIQSSVTLHNNEQSAGNLQELLARRLQGLAYFLDKLLLHKCVLGEDKKKLAESLLEQSLALPVGLKLDESMAPGDFTMDESALDISHSIRIEDLTLMFGHHGLSDDVRKSSGRSVFKGDAIERSLVDRISESECWSEPDRNVSLARMGIGDVAPGNRESSCEEKRRQSRRHRASHQSSVSTDTTVQYELQRTRSHVAHLEEVEKKLSAELEAAERRFEALNTEVAELKKILLEQSAAAEASRQDVERVQKQLDIEQCRRGELETQVARATESVEQLRAERCDLEANFSETERSLRRAADEAALQASQAALERTRAHHERLRLERELEEARERLSAAMTSPKQMQSDEDRPTSPDQGIDSDRLSSLEIADTVSLSPRTLYEENVALKQKLARTKATLGETLTHLNAANMRKMSVDRAICRQIHKTHGVLRKARDQFESHN